LAFKYVCVLGPDTTWVKAVCANYNSSKLTVIRTEHVFVKTVINIEQKKIKY